VVPEHQRLSSDERSNLVAYLDGELPEAQSQAIAAKLTQSMTARREVESLTKTWEMLDLLPRPKASEDFTARTLIEAESLEGRGDRIVSAASDITRRVLVAVGWLAVAVVLGLVGYTITSRLWPNPSARLTRDLSIAESLDAYREVGGIEFLKQLDSAPEFY